MEITVCGGRGSSTASGAGFVRYGGHTSCLAVSRPGEPPRLVLDAGTGLPRVGALLDGAPFHGSILLSHLHWDHTHGIPFFAEADREDARVDLYLPDQGDALAVLERAFSPPHFPITPHELRGNWHFVGLPPGRRVIEGYEVLARDIPHKGGRTFGYRISDGEASVAYLPDHAPLVLGRGPDGWGSYHDAALELAAGVDLLIHDSQYTAGELATAAAMGHATIDYTVALGRLAGARRVMLFHHAPGRTDDQLDALGIQWAGHFPPVTVAAEGQVVSLGENPRPPVLGRTQQDRVP